MSKLADVLEREPFAAHAGSEVLPGGVTEAQVRLLEFTARVKSNSADLLNGLVSLYHVAEVASPYPELRPNLELSAIRRMPHRRCPSFRVSESDIVLGDFALMADAIAYLEHMINSAAVVGLADHVLVHAGVVAGTGCGVLIPAASGAGKSTLVGALCLSGFDYLSDELAVLDLGSKKVLPFLKSICLKDGGWRALLSSFEYSPLPLRATRADGEVVRYLTAPLFCSPESSVPVRYVLLPMRRTGAVANVTPLSRASAVVELARNSLNLPRHGALGLELLASIVEGAECYRLTYDNLRDAVELVSAIVGHAPTLELDG